MTSLPTVMIVDNGIWGDTVSTAKRIKACGQAGAANLSRPAWEQVRDQVR
jgi:hypothetical protein